MRTLVRYFNDIHKKRMLILIVVLTSTVMKSTSGLTTRKVVARNLKKFAIVMILPVVTYRNNQ